MPLAGFEEGYFTCSTERAIDGHPGPVKFSPRLSSSH